MANEGEEERIQHVVVMRHGDRSDRLGGTSCDSEAARPWDPVLTEEGKARARATGARLLELDFPIHRVFVSPFVRCRETAAEVLTSLYSVGETNGQDAPMRSPIKVSIECGLSEAMHDQALQLDESHFPKDGNWFPDLSQLEAIFPEEIVDHSVTPIYQEIPAYGEPVNHARKKIESVIRSLADKNPRENLLLITIFEQDYAEGVWVSVQYFYKHVEMKVECCGFSHLERKISFDSPEEFTAESFNLMTTNNDTGLKYS